MRGIRRGLGAGKLVGDAWSRKQRGLEYLRGVQGTGVARGAEKRVYAPTGIEGEAGKCREEKWAEMSGRETPKGLSVV